MSVIKEAKGTMGRNQEGREQRERKDRVWGKKRQYQCGPGKGMNQDYGSYVYTNQWQLVCNCMGRGRGGESRSSLFLLITGLPYMVMPLFPQTLSFLSLCSLPSWSPPIVSFASLNTLISFSSPLSTNKLWQSKFCQNIW